MEPVCRGLEIAAKAMVAATGTRITYEGLEHIPVIIRVGAPLEPSGPVDDLMTTHPEGAYWVPRRLGGGTPTVEETEVLEKAERAHRDTGGR
ncbi:MAG: hypothetical protein P4L86_13430 [Mycobacterium sp.]|nr:hypothetical protein [Mycobacterium sp.]